MIPAGECGKCGQEHRRCHAHVRREDEGGIRPCGAYPIRGGQVCPVHGGMAPQTQAKAARTLAEREALAKAQMAYPRRRASEILLDALHKADALAQQAEDEGWPDAAAHQAKAEQLAQVALAKDLQAVEDKITEEQGQQLAEVVRRLLERFYQGLVDLLGDEHAAALAAIDAVWASWVETIAPEELRAVDAESGS